MQSSEDQDSLTSRQRELLDFIQGCVGRESRMPSYREMARGLGVAAVGTIQDHIDVLVSKGYLERLTVTKSEKSILKLAGPRQAATITVPIVGEVAAGSMRDAFEVALGSVPVSVHLLGARGRPGEHFALRVTGESMIDAGILPGDIVVVDRRSNVRTGDMVVVDYRGEATLKEIEFPKSGERPVKLIPHNKTMKPIIVEDLEGFRVVGKIVAVQRFL